MNNEFIQWLLGCLFGLIAGWLITWSYYTHRIRDIKYQELITKIDETKNERTRKTRKV